MSKYSTLEEFYFTIGGFHEGYSTVELCDDGFVFYLGNGNRQDNQCILDGHRVIPKKEPLDEFLHSLEDLSVMKWRREYIDTYICDGTQWKLRLTVNGRRRKISGSNNYPEQFEGFRQSIRKLLGSTYVEFESEFI